MFISLNFAIRKFLALLACKQFLVNVKMVLEFYIQTPSLKARDCNIDTAKQISRDVLYCIYTFI